MLATKIKSIEEKARQLHLLVQQMNAKNAELTEANRRLRAEVLTKTVEIAELQSQLQTIENTEKIEKLDKNEKKNKQHISKKIETADSEIVGEQAEQEKINPSNNPAAWRAEIDTYIQEIENCIQFLKNY